MSTPNESRREPDDLAARMMRRTLDARINSFLRDISRDFPGSSLLIMGTILVGEIHYGVGTGSMPPWHALRHLAATWEQMVALDGGNIEMREHDDGTPT